VSASALTYREFHHIGVMLGCVFAAGWVSVSLASAKDIVIAVPAAMHAPHDAVGRSVHEAARATAAALNAAGGVNGDRIVIAVFDDPCATGSRNGSIAEIAASDAAAVIGHACAASAKFAAPYYAKAGKLFIEAGAAHRQIAPVRSTDLAFRLPSAKQTQGRFLAAALAASASDSAKPRIAMLRDRTQLAISHMQDVSKALALAGLNAVSLDTFTGGDKDFSGLAARLAAQRTTHVVLAAFPNEAALLIGDIFKAMPEIKILATDMIASDDFAAAAGPAIGAVRVVMQSDAREFATASPHVAWLSHELGKAGATPSRAAYYTAAALEAWVAAARRVGPGAADVAAHLQTGETADTVIGRVGFDAQGEASVTPWGLYRWSLGRLVPDGKPSSAAQTKP
jgi:branched-chain amino acid transport system substrate-binding protein